MILKTVLHSYRSALERWLPLVAAHIFIRLIIASLMVPVISIALAATLYFSGQTSLTDQDIAKFLLTPAGIIGALTILSMLVIALVLDVMVATVILRQKSRGPVDALRLATGFVMHSAPRLVPFVIQFLIRLLAIVLPFLLLAGAIALLLMGDHDINYYLAERPPEFLAAVGLIGLVVLSLAVVLLIKLSGWAIALHFSAFDNLTASQSFVASKQYMKGNQRLLIGRLLGWVALRSIALTAAGALAALVVVWISDWNPDSLRVLAGSMIASSILYTTAVALINAVSNGALADLLNHDFDRAVRDQKPAGDIAKLAETSSTGRHTGTVIATLAVASLIGIGTGGLLLERLNQDAEAQIIAHRGAAALAPENTMASVMRAIEDGADWVEIDVQENADGDIIVVHDSDFMKSANVATKVWDVTAPDIARIDVGSWFDPAYADERVPLLSDILLAARDKAGVIIELKYYGHDEDLEHRVAKIVEDAGMADQIATMSLKYPAVQKMLEVRPTWRTGVLAATYVGDPSGLDGDFLALNQARIGPRVVERANAAGKDVYAWTVNDPMTITRMLWIGVDGLITDDPAQTRKVVQAYNELSVPERIILALSDRISTTIDPEEISELRP